MSEWERRRRAESKVRRCFTGGAALSALRCTVEQLRQAVDAKDDSSANRHIEDIASLAHDVKRQFGLKSPAAKKIAEDFGGLSERVGEAFRSGSIFMTTPTGTDQALAYAEKALPEIFEVGSALCGKALAPPKPRGPRKKKTPEEAVPAAVGRRGR